MTERKTPYITANTPRPEPYNLTWRDLFCIAWDHAEWLERELERERRHLRIALRIICLQQEKRKENEP